MRYPLALLFALLLVGLAMPTLALSYSFALLGDLGGGGAEARDINDSRQVVGDSDLAGGGWSAFRWEGGVMTDLPELPGYSLSSARGINSSGAVTGSTRASSPYSEHSTVWSGGSLTDLGTLGGSFSTGDGINSAGDVAGSGWLSDGRNRGYVWDSSTGTTTVLSPLGTGDHCWALDLNDSGLVAGYSQHTNGDYGTHAYVWDGTTMTDLGVPDGHSESEGWAINNSGVVGGWAAIGDGYDGFLWDAGNWTIIGSGSGYYSAVMDINDTGDAVGFYQSEADGFFAFLYSGGTLINLNDYAPSGYLLDEATGINANGDICGNGMDAEERDIAWVLVREGVSGEIPEPGTFALTGLGLVCLLFVRRRRQTA